MDSPLAAQAVASGRLTIALAGNPNAGKTTVFNMMTGARQHVANYPGVTVDLKEGSARLDNRTVKVVDLPGAYSLNAYSTEEIVTRNFIIEQLPDVVVNVVDASNLERNLYLTVQLMELGVPVVVALNMFDIVQRRGLTIDTAKLSVLLGVPVVPTVASRDEGVDDLLKTADALALAPQAARKVDYGREVEPHIDQLTSLVASCAGLQGRARWFAVKMLEDDEVTRNRVRSLCPSEFEKIAAECRRIRAHVEKICGHDITTVLADRRYGFIAGACAEAVRRTCEAHVSKSELIDRLVLHPWMGLPIFGAAMYLMFLMTFTLGEPMMTAMAGGIRWFSGLVYGLWPAQSESFLRSLVVDGVLGGVGGVLSYLPNILLLFLAIAFLEDSGYMARAAFIMDRLMHKIGLHGKSFIPMLIGFGCTVPAIMATRTLETRRDRLTTIMVLPLMSCGARLPIYVLMIPAFFPKTWQAPVMGLIYLTGVLLAVVAARVLRSTLFKGESVPFVMELPPYRMPSMRGLLIHVWDRGWQFVKKAGTLILGISVLLWSLSVWPQPGAEKLEPIREQLAVAAGANDPARLAELENQVSRLRLENSAIGRIGNTIAPAFAPLGFDWRVSTALIGAFAAKEMFVAQMGIVHSLGQTDEHSSSLQEALRDTYTPLQGFCIMLFCLISMPCMATVAVTRKETGSWKWAALQLGGLTVTAWIVTAAVYQLGRLATG
ncbi:MAG: ferrous iron transport protein B [Planctomycetes bacterium]|jgi:ferrous iron transport protein B|nr:ferrous iron transport protein B [Planctomycetota bacterium]